MARNPKREAMEVVFGPLFNELVNLGISPIWAGFLFMILLTLVLAYAIKRRKRMRIKVKLIHWFAFYNLVICDVLGFIGAILHQIEIGKVA
jgi:small-conductance mechanosensitive channel